MLQDDAARNSMLIVAEAGVFWVWEHWHIRSIRLIRDASIGISWIGLAAVGKAAFMLVRKVFVREDMVKY